MLSPGIYYSLCDYLHFWAFGQEWMYFGFVQWLNA